MTTMTKPTATTNRRKKAFSPADAILFTKTVLLTNPTTKKDDLIKNIVEKLTKEFPVDSFPSDVITTMAQEIYRQASEQIIKEKQKETEIDSISPADLEAIQELISSNSAAILKAFSSSPDFSLLSESGSSLEILSPASKRKNPTLDLLIAFTAHALTTYHISGWIRYEKKEIFALAKLNKLSIAEQEELVRKLHSSFGLDMRVVGSAQPIPCYNAPWVIPPTDIKDSISKLDPVKVVTSLVAALKDSLKTKEIEKETETTKTGEQA